MNVGIIDADLLSRTKHRFPNLACMKISAYCKSLGHSVKLLLSYDEIGNFDHLSISKVFTDTQVPENILKLPNISVGGTGFFYDKAEPLPYDVEHVMPDYHLYDEFVAKELRNEASKTSLQFYTDYSIGYMTRGCIRGCSFCVNKNYRKCVRHSSVSEFLYPNRKYICLLDDNVLACSDWRNIFDELNATGKRFQFKQGMDERLLTDEKCKTIFSSNWIGDYIFAFDNIKDSDIVISKLKMIRKHTNKPLKFYVFCAYNHDTPGQYSDEFWKKDIEETFYRISVLMKYGAKPYIMKYADYEKSPYRGMYVNLSGWCNQPSLIKKMSFREFSSKRNGAGGAADRYMQSFQKQCPDIAERYFDMKWSDVCA